MTPRLAPAAVFVGFALAAGVLQVIATLTLGLASVDSLQAAAREGSIYYVVGALGTGLGLLGLWLLRRRPLIGSIGFFVWEVALLITLGRRTSSLGLAYHGEYILHHFAATLAAAACVSTGVVWARRSDLGGARWAPVGLALAGGLGLLLVHVLPQPGLGVRIPAGLEDMLTATALLSAPVALAVYWKATAHTNLRWVSVALLVPLLLRVLLAWPEGLSGGSVPDGWGRTALVVSVVGAATLTFVLFRPSTPRPIKVLVWVLSGLATALLYLIYRRAFGELEDGIGGLAQSLFGFSLPYPNYVPGWQVFIVSVAIFFIFDVIYSGLMSWDERVRGVTLGLLAVSGLGLSNPQLVLMVAAGHLLWIDTLVTEGQARVVSPPPAPVEDVLRRVASSLELAAPVVLETAQGAVVALRGEIDGTQLDLRARPGRGDAWNVTLEAGIVERGRARVELAPDASEAGPRPDHPIGKSHRVRGSLRSLEQVGDETLDALRAFADSRAQFWPAGAKIEFGQDLARFEPASVAALLRAVAHR